MANELSSFVADFGVFLYAIVGAVGYLRASELGKERAMAVALVTLSAIYFHAYIFSTYYHVSTPLINSIVELGNTLMRYLSRTPGIQTVSGVPSEITIITWPFNNTLLDALYGLGLFSYTSIVTIAVVSFSAISSIINFIRSLIKR